MSVPKWVGVVAGIWLAAYLAGRYTGHAISPEWESPDEVRRYAAQHVTLWRNAGGEDVLRFACGPLHFEYAVARDAVEEPLDPSSYTSGSVVRRGLSDTELVGPVAAALGIVSIKTVPQMFEQLGHIQGKGVVAAAVVGGLFGFGLGLKGGYQSEPDCTKSTSAEPLRDRRFWRSLADLPAFKDALQPKSPALVPLSPLQLLRLPPVAAAPPTHRTLRRLDSLAPQPDPAAARP